MAVSYVGGAAGGSTSGVSINLPAGVQVGDLLVAAIHIAGPTAGATVTPPPGWTQVRTNAVSGLSRDFMLYAKTATASEPASYTWTTSAGGTAAEGTLVALRNAATSSTSWTLQYGTGSQTGHKFTSTAQTPVSGSMLLALGDVQASASSFSTPSGWTFTAADPAAEVAGFYQNGAGTSVPATDFANNSGAGTAINWACYTIVVPINNTAPNAPTGLAPASGTVDRSVIQRLSWTFSDPDTGDSQSKFDLQWRHKGTTDTWNVVSQTTPNNYYDVPASTFPAEDIEWQVRTYDQAGAVGPYSALTYFTAADPAIPPTITAPTSGGTISANPTNVTWSTAGQQGYQLRRVRDNAGVADTTTIYYDTGQITDTTTRTVSVPFETNNRWEWVQVRVQQGGLWSAWSSIRVNVSYTQPATATLVAAGNNTTGAITVTITNPTPSGGQPTVSYNDVYVRTVGDTSAGVRIATGVANNGTATYWTPASGVAYEFLARTFGSNSTSTDSAWTA